MIYISHCLRRSIQMGYAKKEHNPTHKEVMDFLMELDKTEEKENVINNGGQNHVPKIRKIYSYWSIFIKK